jgi:transketolase N-terminal domain/subunit
MDKRIPNSIRFLSMDAVQAANSGHPGMPMGMADVATVLFFNHLKFGPKTPSWPDRDRLILSAGHGSMLLYSLLYLTGYEDFPIEEIKNFRQLGARTAGHPENFLSQAIETTTGPLGQGIANSVGFAMAEEIQRASFGKNVIDHYTYVFAGDGCLMEGVSQEAITLAGRQELSKLIVFWDNNKITIDGKVSCFRALHCSDGVIPIAVTCQSEKPITCGENQTPDYDVANDRIICSDVKSSLNSDTNFTDKTDTNSTDKTDTSSAGGTSTNSGSNNNSNSSNSSNDTNSSKCPTDLCDRYCPAQW